MMEMHRVFADSEALKIAESVAHFLATRLNRSFESQEELCFSYTPGDNTQIYNSSALAAVFLARVGCLRGDQEYLSLARKAMVFLQRGQLESGGWYYGQLRRQRWIDGFHTSYNVCALLDYQRTTGDHTFKDSMLLGHRYYKATFFTDEGAPKYFHDRTFPIDIHSCSQAILQFLIAFSFIDPETLELAWKTFHWTMSNMVGPRVRFTISDTVFGPTARSTCGGDKPGCCMHSPNYCWRALDQIQSASPRSELCQPGWIMILPGSKMRIWIDLDNSPHAQFFPPLIEQGSKGPATRFC